MTSHMPMGTARQPFAPLNSSRLQNITSIKNRQNALSPNNTSPKRKATSFESDDDSENVDPIFFESPKRSKAVEETKDTYSKPTSYFLTKAPPSPTEASLTSPLKPIKSTTQRKILQTRTQTPKATTTAPKSTPLTAPAGRSPTRKRVGILNNHRRASGSITRVDPPKFSTSKPSGLSFSIDAALSGTIPSYGARQRQALSSKGTKAQTSQKEIPSSIRAPEGKSSWFFQIHEDTEEEHATNLMEHSTGILDISSDEETLTRLRDERGKENVPPLDDISQTRTSLTAFASSSSMSTSRKDDMEIREMKMRIKMQQKKRREMEEGAIDVDRAPLGEMRKEDFYAEGCDEKSVFIILPDPEPEVSVEEEEEEAEKETEAPLEQKEQIPEPQTTTPLPEPVSTAYAPGKGKGKGKGKEIDIEFLMQKKVVEPMEKPEADFVVWESGSAKDENE
ncbi:hypothetical protein BOTNAR_0005g00730 [Botryotinia narcissicola]|uniref:Uncharacterized protein n=1 Tax=Botryotinia narcissicola TaxID=278944 RepID=A0A4Z1J8K0_9HELO|nr:hypothetical protein BOTNAR_0005g00730 [Botryotinia narcissicola]